MYLCNKNIGNGVFRSFTLRTLVIKLKAWIFLFLQTLCIYTIVDTYILLYLVYQYILLCIMVCIQSFGLRIFSNFYKCKVQVFYKIYVPVGNIDR